jgi:hypothetical protein
VLDRLALTMITALSCNSRRLVSAAALEGFDWLSSTTRLTGWPLMPPALLALSKYIRMDSITGA